MAFKHKGTEAAAAADQEPKKRKRVGFASSGIIPFFLPLSSRRRLFISPILFPSQFINPSLMPVALLLWHSATASSSRTSIPSPNCNAPNGQSFSFSYLQILVLSLTIASRFLLVQ